jgi:hypothetical protein
MICRRELAQASDVKDRRPENGDNRPKGRIPVGSAVLGFHDPHDMFSNQRVTEVPELVIATGFPALMTPAVCGAPWSGLVRDDKARPDTAMPATSATTTILR